MLTLFNIVIAPIAMGILSHYAAVIAVGNHMEKNKTFLGFVTDLQSRVYFCIGFTLLVWFIDGESTLYFMYFMFGYFVTFLRVDFDSVEEYYAKGNKDL